MSALLWINRGDNALPKWLEPHVAEARAGNGSLLIRTQIGRDKCSARVLVGNAAFVRKNIAYTAPVGDVSALVMQLREAEAADPKGATRRVSPQVAAKPEVVQSQSAPRMKVKLKADDRKRTYSAPLGTPPSIEWVPTDRLMIDDTYQRTTENYASQRLIKSIAANFDWRLCAPLIVSRRADGNFAVIDGQHRTLAAKLRHDIPHLPCCLFNYDGPEDEAKMFIAANRSRKPMNRLDDFHAALAAADDEALQILQLVTDAGLQVARNTSSTSWKPGEIAFTASIASTLRKHGQAIVSQALSHLAEAFPDQKVVQAGSIYLGIVNVLVRPPKDFDNDRLFRALLKYDADGWGSFVQGLKGGNTRADAIKEALLMAYEETNEEEVA